MYFDTLLANSSYDNHFDIFQNDAKESSDPVKTLTESLLKVVKRQSKSGMTICYRLLYIANKSSKKNESAKCLQGLQTDEGVMFWEQQGGRAGNGEKKRFAFLIFISVFLYHSDFRIKFLRSA